MELTDEQICKICENTLPVKMCSVARDLSGCCWIAKVMKETAQAEHEATEQATLKRVGEWLEDRGIYFSVDFDDDSERDKFIESLKQGKLTE